MMTRDLVVGVDCSTTACKALAFDERGQIQGEARSAIRLDNPAPDAWQQDAETWWQGLLGAVRQLTDELGAGARGIRAVCVTHQRETFVLTDERGRPLHPALVWMDARCRPQVAAAVRRFGAERLHARSGKPACTTPSMYKLMYVLEQQPELAAQKPRLLDVHGFLVWRLTGRFATSLGSADPTGLVDMPARAWSAELAELAGITLAQLPELVAPGREIGRLEPEPAAMCGLAPGLPVIAGAGDGQAAGLGAGVVDTGQAYLNLGTAVVSGVLARDYRCDPAFRTLFGAADGTYFLESDLQGGTFTLSWLVDRWLRHGRNDDQASVDAILAELEQQAVRLPPGADGLIVVPYWNGVMDPYWDDDATGIVVGWTGSHGPGHLYRAILEGIAFEQRLHTEGIEQAAGPVHTLAVLGGGSKSQLWCQILADVLEKPLARAASHEATALGAAMLAAVAVGMHADLTAAARVMTATTDRFEPGAARSAYQALYEQVYRDLFPALQPSLSRLARLRRTAEQG